MRWLLAVVALASCKSADTVPTIVSNVENKLGRKLDGVILAPQGIYVDRVFVTDTALPDALAKAKPRELLDIWLLDDAEPATTIIGALQVVADKHPLVRIHWKLDDDQVAELCPRAKLSSQQAGIDERVALSILFNPDRIWFGISRVNEFQDIPATSSGVPDYQKLEDLLKQHKASAFFVDRRDLELSADPKVTSGAFAAGLAVVCRFGWTELSMLRLDQISARPTL